MEVDRLIGLYDLEPEPALASVPIADCQLHFHRQQATKDLWCIAVGPLGTLIFPFVEHDLLEHVRASGQTTSRPRGRSVSGLRIDIDENVAVVLRASGRRLDGNYVFPDGSPFGGFGGGLPSALKPTLRQRIADLVSGRRGAVVSFGYDAADVEAARPKPRP